MQSTIRDDKILIPIEDYAALIQAQTQLNIVKRYLKRCDGPYVDTSFLIDILDMDQPKAAMKDV